MMPPTVIIPSRNAANLVACLGALRKHEPDCPVIVVDDGIDWNQIPVKTSDRWGDIRFIPGVKPFVFARNCNIGIRAAGDSDVVLLNDDALLESPGGFRLMQRASQFRTDVGIIGATTNVTGQTLQYRQLRMGTDDAYVGLRIVPHIAFVCVLIPRRTIESVGMLDEDFIGYGGEDRSYCESVTRAGLKVTVHDGCYVDHASLRSTFRGDPHAAGNISLAKELLLKKWGKLQS